MMGVAASAEADTSWPHVDGVQHHFVTIGGTRIHVAEAGSGPPLVLLHGWPQHWWSFRKIIAPLALEYRVICPDIRGLGWSASGSSGYELVRLAADLVALLDALQLPRTRLVGHDWGAAIGYVACLQFPERFEKFVALAAVTPWSANDGALRLVTNAWHVFALGIFGRLALHALALPRRALRAWSKTRNFSPEEERVYLDRFASRAVRLSTARYYRNLTFRELPYFLRNAARMRLRTSTLHLNGALDPLTRGVSHGYAPFADDMRLDLVPDCGHYLAEEQPHALVRRLLSFLSHGHANEPALTPSAAR